MTFFEQLLHPLTGNGYQFWSGIGSDFGELSILVAIIVAGRHLNCHEPSCIRMGRHLHHASGTRWCRKHIPDDLRAAHPKPEQLKR